MIYVIIVRLFEISNIIVYVKEYSIYLKFKLFNSLIALFMDNVFFYKKRSVNRGTQKNTHSSVAMMVEYS